MRPFRLVLGVAAAAVLAACSSGGDKKKFAYVERPVEQIYADAARQLERKRWDEAVELFAEVERQHPYSAWARRAMLMRAFARYQTNDYDEAIEALDQFISLHPGNKDAPYAYYLKAMCHYERIADVGRDQENTDNAVKALNDVIRRYPNTEYARDARLKLDLTYDHLAGKEMYVGRYYLKQYKHIAAINRFKYVVDNYQTTDHVPEALYRLVEAYLQIGVVDEARAAAAVLGANYPGSVWYADAYKLFKRNNLIDSAGLPVARPKKAAAKPGEKPGEVKAPDLGDAVDAAPVTAQETAEELVPNAGPDSR
ncbi:MAG: outer membrane protein assembly factor BamD [Parvularculaceae bacterium]|jgi:outer membrane protein assembly factor BamD|nr:outer membrane protein assembly factor BamD [Parvularculaceae bacterium]